MITLLDKQGKEIQEQDKIMERIEEFYSELYDSDEAVTIQTDPEEVPPIMAWEVEAALRKMNNGNEAGKDQFSIETLQVGDETIAKQIAKLYTKCITGRRIPKTFYSPRYGTLTIYLSAILKMSATAPSYHILLGSHLETRFHGT